MKCNSNSQNSNARRGYDFCCRARNPCSITLKIWAFATSVVGMPLRVILRREFSVCFHAGTLPVYLVRCDENFNAGWDLFNDALTVLEENAPIWWRRMPQLLESIMLIDKVNPSAFYFADKCCGLNPWKVQRHIKDQADAAIVLAGFLVHVLCIALLWSDHRGYFGVRNRHRLSLKANIRFLERCLRISNGLDVKATIKALKSYCGD